MHTRFLLVLPLTIALAAQTAAPVEAPHACIDTVGPDGWRMRFGPTNLGSLLESAKGKELWEPRVQPLLGKWRQLFGDDAVFAESRARMLGYGGHIRIGVWFAAGLEWNLERARHGAIVLDGDGRTDLAALAKDLRGLQQHTLAGEWVDVDVAGTKVPTHSHEGRRITAPLLEGGHLLIVFTRDGDVAAALARARQLAVDVDGQAPSSGPALRLRYDAAAVQKLKLAAAAETERAVMLAEGEGSVGETTVTIGTAGPHVQVEIAQQFTNDERGLFGALFPAAQGTSPLLHAAVAGPGAWKLGRFDFGRLHKVNEDVAVARGATREAFRATTEQRLGFDPEKLLKQLTDEVLWVRPPIANEDRLIDATWSLTIRLRDEAAFTKELVALVPKVKPWFTTEAMVEEGPHGDIAVYRYDGFGYPLWLAAGNGVFVFAGGDDAEELVGTMLDRCKALPKQTPAAVPGFEALHRHQPPGTNGFAAADVRSVVLLAEAILPFLDLPVLQSLYDVRPLDPDVRDAMLALFAEHRLDVVRTATGFHERHWRWRLFW